MNIIERMKSEKIVDNDFHLGLQNGAKIIEILIVAHGGAHNDTICMAERKISHQPAFEFNTLLAEAQP